MDCLLQFCLLSGILQGMQSSLPQWAPAARSVENMFFSFNPPASWNFTRNPVISQSSSSFSFSFLVSKPPLVLGTKITVDGCTFLAVGFHFFLLMFLFFLPAGSCPSFTLLDLYQLLFF